MLWGFVRWLVTPAGRVLRAVAGLFLLFLAFSTRNSFTSVALYAVVGLLSLIGGVFDLSFLSAVMGGPLRGAELRETEENRV